MKLTKVMAVCFYVVGICVVLGGIVVEVTMKANMGFVLITVGSVVIAGGAMVFAKLVRGGKGYGSVGSRLTLIASNSILILKWLRKVVPKFRHGEACGVKYSTRAVGFWRRFPFRLLPYLTGDISKIHLRLRRESDWWPEGILRIEPPVLVDVPLYDEPTTISISDYPFDIGNPPTWEATLSLKGGSNFPQPCYITCYLVLQKVNGDEVKRCSVHIADIQVIGRDSFITNCLMWIIAIIASGLIGYWIAILTQN